LPAWETLPMRPGGTLVRRRWLGVERAPVPGVVPPGAFTWRLAAWPLLVGVLAARIEHNSMRQPVLLTGRSGELRATPGALALPPVAAVPPPPDWLPNAAAVREWQRLATILTADADARQLATSLVD
jgi:hypothetical protein